MVSKIGHRKAEADDQYYTHILIAMQERRVRSSERTWPSTEIVQQRWHHVLMSWRPDDRDDWRDWDEPTDVSRSSVRRVLLLMAEGRLHPEMALAWARKSLPPEGDPQLERAWSLLLRSADRVDGNLYLFTGVDYAAWADDLVAG